MTGIDNTGVMVSGDPTDAARPPATRWWRRWAWRGALGLILFLCLSEIVLRLVLGLGNPVLYQYDQDCGYLPVPNQQVYRFFCHNDINSFSMRSAPIAPQKPPGVLRVMCVGDSVTYGTTHLDQPKIFTSLLADELPGKLHRPVEVLNASTGAWAVANELGYLKSRGTFGADVVLFILNTGDLVQQENRPRLTLSGGYPDHRPPLALYELWVRYVAPRILRPGAGADPGSLASESPDVDHLTPIVLEQLSEGRRIAAKSGAKFGVVYSPAHGGEWDAPAYARGWLLLKQWAARNEVPLIDLTETYAAVPAREVYQDGIHLSERGNRLAADAIERKWPW